MRTRDRLSRLVLRLYPQEFRERFGDDMTAAYREARADAAMRGRRGVAQFWWGAAVDALVRAPGEHMRLTWQDIRYAARSLRRTPLYTLIAIATLALGIGGNTAIFGVVHAVALQTLPSREPARLVRVSEKNDTLQIPRFSASVLNYYSWRERATSFADLGAWRTGGATMATGGDPQRMSKLEVTWTLLPMLGVAPIAGRVFTADEDRAAAGHVAILAESVWRGRFGGDPAVIGRPIVIDGIPHTVVGVIADSDFLVPIELVVPMAADLSAENRSNHVATVIGRLKPGVTMPQAQREMDTIALQLGKEYPKDDADWGVTLSTVYDWIVPDAIRTGLYVVLSAVALVLLIACTNIANLALARASLRRREQAVRLALGATRGRLVREVLTESMLLAACGGSAGVIVAWWAVPILRTQLAPVLPRADSIGLSTPVLLFAAAVSIATGALFGALPAVMHSRRDVLAGLKDESRGGGVRHHTIARRMLVVAQLALATILLAGAALLGQSFVRLERVDLGFRAARLTTAMVGLPPGRYPDQAARWQFFSRLIADVAGSAGVEAVGISSGAPFAGGNTGSPARALGPNALGTAALQSDWRIVSAGYFSAMGIPLLRGRTFGNEDRAGGSFVIILSADMARRFWPGEDPIGRIILNAQQQFRVVGVVGDVRSLNQALDPRPTMYLSTTQFMPSSMALTIRGRSDLAVAPIVRQAVAALDPQLAVYNVRTMETLLANASAQPRVTAWLVGLFAALAVLLAGIGVYGVLACLVAQRTREIGVRIALGAAPRSVLALVVTHALRLSAAGVAIGVAAAVLLAPRIESQLFGVTPYDAATLISVPIALLVIATLASYVPARRATRVDPLTALRAE
jgi:putative ABC transport system permease protein